jgi:hypothetical protein
LAEGIRVEKDAIEDAARSRSRWNAGLRRAFEQDEDAGPVAFHVERRTQPAEFDQFGGASQG